MTSTVSTSISTVKGGNHLKPTKEISAIEAARRLGIGLDYLYSLLWTGKVEAHKVNRQWRVSVAAVDDRLKGRGE
jgi:excisionase family DNA binding protein